MCTLLIHTLVYRGEAQSASPSLPEMLMLPIGLVQNMGASSYPVDRWRGLPCLSWKDGGRRGEGKEVDIINAKICTTNYMQVPGGD